MISALACLAVPVWLAASAAPEFEVWIGAAGAAIALGGLASVRALLLRRRREDRVADIEHLLASSAFFLVTLGSVAMLAGVGIYH